MYAENPKQFNKTYRIQIAYTEQEIDTIIWMGVFCGDKTGFVRPGHNVPLLILFHSTEWLQFYIKFQNVIISPNSRLF